jgi:uncharacterized protein
MPPTHKIISAVDHVVEHPDVWAGRLTESKWGDRIPHLEHLPDGSDCWVIDGRKLQLADLTGMGALMADRDHPPRRWEEIPPTAYDPAQRLMAMDQSGVEYAVLYPTVAGFSGENFGAITEPQLELDCARAYNDWLIEEWASTSERFIPQCIVPLFPADTTVAEIKRAVAKGHRGVLFPAAPMQLRALPHLNSPDYDPIWAACQEIGVPLCFHAGSSPQLFRFPVAPTLAPELAAALRPATRPATVVFDLAKVLFSRILLRFPRLKVVFAESTIGWGTFFLEHADHEYEQDHSDYEQKPSEMFQRQCYLTTWYAPVKVNARHTGKENILWATNFPMANTTAPDTGNFVTKCLAELSEEEARQILWANAAKLYGVL